MNNVLVYCELEENGLAQVSLELLSKGRKLANQLGVALEAVAAGSGLEGLVEQVAPYGVDILHCGDDPALAPYTTLPHAAVVCRVVEETRPQILLVGATSTGRDLAPRVSGRLRVGLTADCTDLQIGDHTEPRTGKTFTRLLYQIRPAFGGNIIATIVNPETRPQMATVREGVMKAEIVSPQYRCQVRSLPVTEWLDDSIRQAVRVISRELQPRKVNLGAAPVIVAGGFGVGSREGFDLLQELAGVLGGEVGASRAAVDAGLAGHERQIGQTGVTVRPRLYIAVGISGAIQHSAGMDGSGQIISINTDPDAPINQLADVAIIGDFAAVIPKMIRYYREESK